MLPGPIALPPYGPINLPGTHLHRVLLNIALEHHRCIVETGPEREQQVPDTLWTGLQGPHPRPGLPGLSELAVNPVTVPTARSPQCPGPHT